MAVQAMTAGGVLQKIGQLKQEMARTLADLGDKLAAEVDKCSQVQQAIEGASKLGSFGSPVHTLKEQTRKPAGEE